LDRLRRLLRALAVVVLVLSSPFVGFLFSFLLGSERAHILLYRMSGIPTLALGVVGLLFVRELFREFDARQAADTASRLAWRYGTWLAIAWGAAQVLATAEWAGKRLSMQPLMAFPGVVLRVTALIAAVALLFVGLRILELLRTLRTTLYIEEHQWWFKPDVGWASVAISTGMAELIEPTGERCLFHPPDAAYRWLSKNDYVSESRALLEGFALGAPPPIIARHEAAGADTGSAARIQRLRVSEEQTADASDADAEETAGIRRRQARKSD
jgi:hypothetical protein